MFFKKIYEKIESCSKNIEDSLKRRIMEFEASVADIKQVVRSESTRIIDEQDGSVKHGLELNDTNHKEILNKFNNLDDKTKSIDESLKKLNNQYESYHADVLDKMNKAGELILSYENFYQSTLSELSEIFRFIEMLNKRPMMSSDPDFVNFNRAIQMMGDLISKYSALNEDISKAKKEVDEQTESNEKV
ncbi:MAG: hypothetical protein AABY22_05085 [Nanoarchaeota archaeon]